MKKRLLWLRFLLLLLAVFGISMSYAQEISLSGRVTDAADGSTIPGVTIVVKNTTIGTVTDINGKYTLKVNPGAVLVFSYVGYQTQEITISNQRVLDVVLSSAVKSLSEVVVIGYGQVKKGDATGSVSAIDKKDFNQGNIASPQQQMIGKIPGVTITTVGGAPGGDAVIRIRGGSSINASNDPLIVIDGVPTDNSTTSGSRGTLGMLNPNDIESYVVLKDASATAIYGSRASNGVIIITTKKGKAGEKKVGVEYNGNVTINANPKTVKVLSGDEFRKDVLEKYPDNPAVDTLLGTANTDWQKQIFRTAVSTDHNFSFYGGTKYLPYRFSAGYFYNDGILRTDNTQRTTLGLNLNPNLFDDHLKINLSGKYMYQHNRFADQGSINEAIAFDPTQPVYADNKYGKYWTWIQPNGVPVDQATTNPLAHLMQKHDLANVNRFLGNAQLDYKLHFFPDLRLNLNLGYDYTNANGTVYVPINAKWSYLNKGNDNYYNQTKKNSVFDFYANYVKDVKSIWSKFDVMAGYSWQHFYVEGNTYNSNIPHEAIHMDTQFVKKEYYLVSFFGRFNYTLLGRYLLTATLRDDGSSKFAKENRWGLFPSVALAWRINDEPFLKDVKWLTQLKLRGGWGKTGQQDITDNWYPYMPIYTLGDGYTMYQFGNTYYYTLRPEAYDSKIKWEETSTWNAGIDFGFLNDRITGSFEYYYRKTNDLLNKIQVAAGTNLSNYIYTNVGDMENKGFEMNLNFKPYVSKTFNWDLGVNMAMNTNKITKLTATDDPSYTGIAVGSINGGVGNTCQMQTVNYPMYSFFVYQQVYDKNGNPIEGLFVDRNHDGKITDADRYHYKSPNPDATFGGYMKFNYLKWTLSFAGHGAIGNYVYDNVNSQYGVYSNLYHSEGPYLSNIVTTTSDANFINHQYLSDYYIENASYFKLDYVTLSYNFGNLAKNTANLTLSFTVNNVFTITKYKGIDPELSNGTTVGIDNQVYPRTRAYVLGINLLF
ncbi:MAG: TonB-dependent receptor [Bacteroidota bacterium]|nr:TonB-dependent receptor [Bacteroidota bacterium]